MRATWAAASAVFTVTRTISEPPIDVVRKLRELAATPPGPAPVISVYLDARWVDEHQRDRVADELEQHEGDEGHAQQHGRRLAQPAQQEGQHQPRGARRPTDPRRAWQDGLGRRMKGVMAPIQPQ